jgi:hypothetical protein
LNTIYWLLVIVVLVAMTFAGWIRPTGLLSRTRAQEEQDSQRDAVAKWLEKDGEQTK